MSSSSVISHVDAVLGAGAPFLYTCTCIHRYYNYSNLLWNYKNRRRHWDISVAIIISVDFFSIYNSDLRPFYLKFTIVIDDYFILIRRRCEERRKCISRQSHPTCLVNFADDSRQFSVLQISMKLTHFFVWRRFSKTAQMNVG